ncbi:MAG TPA: NAD-dependent epimerase [Deltaproteobacteria bacterium]|nr:MAG: SDR family oxidoreductase [Pseudomonadota bacterium]HBM53015.1 NAD-dependent epimerase [Deltaproteobacteria bacterium]|tara:strand:+ start:3110 stop:4084 length:975 start_codon:yes stop_codon:yes gene_type:complete
MHVLITGGAGMLGRKLAQRLIQDQRIGEHEITKLTLADITTPKGLPKFEGAYAEHAMDMGDPDSAETLIQQRPEFIFHLAAVVSGEAEADFEKGYRVNLDSTRYLLEAIRAQTDYCPRVIFTSSIAVFGVPFPDPIPDTHHRTPLSSYGTQKAIGELLLADYSRRGILQGIGLRLPTICIRPGLPNKAASSFFSGILREPLNGKEAVLPVSDDVRHWHASPRAAVGFFLHAATIDLELVGWDCNLTLPGLCASVKEQIEALERAAGKEAVELIRREPDPFIEKLVYSWPQSFEAEKARSLGFKAENNFDEIIKIYMEEELGATS